MYIWNLFYHIHYISTHLKNATYHYRVLFKYSLTCFKRIKTFIRFIVDTKVAMSPNNIYFESKFG